MSRNKSLKRFIKNVDIFGHKVELNFDNKGPSHQSLLGSFMTCLFFAFIVTFVVFSSIKMSLGEHDLVSSSVMRVNE
jgi:hypothetical protein